MQKTFIARTASKNWNIPPADTSLMATLFSNKDYLKSTLFLSYCFSWASEIAPFLYFFRSRFYSVYAYIICSHCTIQGKRKVS